MGTGFPVPIRCGPKLGPTRGLVRNGKEKETKRKTHFFVGDFLFSGLTKFERRTSPGAKIDVSDMLHQHLFFFFSIFSDSSKLLSTLYNMSTAPLFCYPFVCVCVFLCIAHRILFFFSFLFKLFSGFSIFYFELTAVCAQNRPWRNIVVFFFSWKKKVQVFPNFNIGVDFSFQRHQPAFYVQQEMTEMSDFRFFLSLKKKKERQRTKGYLIIDFLLLFCFVFLLLQHLAAHPGLSLPEHSA